MPSPSFIPQKQDSRYNLSSNEPKYSANEQFIPPNIQFLSKQLKPNQSMKNIMPVFREQGAEHVDSVDGYIGYIPPPIENLIIGQTNINNMQPTWPQQGATSNCINAPTPPPTPAPTPCIHYLLYLHQHPHQHLHQHPHLHLFQENLHHLLAQFVI